MYCVDGKVVYKMFPSISFGCLCGMVLIALTFRLQFHSHVCYLIYAVHKQMLDYWFVYVIRVPCASVMDLQDCPIYALSQVWHFSLYYTGVI